MKNIKKLIIYQIFYNKLFQLACILKYLQNTLVLAQKFCKSKIEGAVTPYIYNNKKFKIKNFSSVKDLSYHRWTIDYKEDYLFGKKIYNNLYNHKKYFDMYDILKLLSEKPELMKINYHIEKTNNLIR